MDKAPPLFSLESQLPSIPLVGGSMGHCEKLSDIMGIVFPNRIRAILRDCRVLGLSGPYPFEMLEKIGQEMALGCPPHDSFIHQQDHEAVVSSSRRLIQLPPHPDFVVRYIHFEHEPKGMCEILAIAAGPPDAINLLRAERAGAIPLTRRELQLTLDLAAGRSLQQVAEQEGVSINTVRNQVKNAMRATSTHSQAHLASVVRDWLL